jgi:hypothetical protein
VKKTASEKFMNVDRGVGRERGVDPVGQSGPAPCIAGTMKDGW